MTFVFSGADILEHVSACACAGDDRQTADIPPVDGDIVDAHVLLYLGDSVSTDQISLAGSIAKNTPAARYLASKGYAALFKFCPLGDCCLRCFDAVGWVARKGIRPVKNLSGEVLAWLSVCRLAYGRADATVTYLYLASVESRLVLPFWYRLTQAVPEKGPSNVVCVCV